MITLQDVWVSIIQKMTLKSLGMGSISLWLGEHYIDSIQVCSGCREVNFTLCKRMEALEQRLDSLEGNIQSMHKEIQREKIYGTDNKESETTHGL